MSTTTIETAEEPKGPRDCGFYKHRDTRHYLNIDESRDA